MRHKNWIVLGLLGWLAGSHPGQVFAWGQAGHQAIALLAQDRLSPKAKAWLQETLQGERIEMAAVWPDRISHRRKETGPWHYINLPIRDSAAAEHWQRYCGEGGCVVSAVDEDLRILKDSQAPSAQRKDALRFLIHFVADLHQPLHCADDDDRGGNNKVIYSHGRRSSLHQLFDDCLLSHRSARPELVSRFIEKNLSKPGIIHQAQLGTPPDWVAESFALAREKIYPVYKNKRGNLSREDIAAWQPLVDQRLALAVLRLDRMIEVLAK